MDTFTVFHAPTTHAELPAGIYRIRENHREFPSAQLLVRCTYVSDAIEICKWLNQRPSLAWASLLDEWKSSSFELTRAGQKLRAQASRPTDVKIVAGTDPFVGTRIWHRFVTTDADLREADDFFRTLNRYAVVKYSYWQNGHGSCIERVLEEDE